MEDIETLKGQLTEITKTKTYVALSGGFCKKKIIFFFLIIHWQLLKRVCNGVEHYLYKNLVELQVRGSQAASWCFSSLSEISVI